MKTFIKTALVAAFLFTPAWPVIAAAVVACMAMDTVGVIMRAALGLPDVI